LHKRYNEYYYSGPAAVPGVPTPECKSRLQMLAIIVYKWEAGRQGEKKHISSEKSTHE
jgi:hypothetical protein